MPTVHYTLFYLILLQLITFESCTLLQLSMLHPNLIIPIIMILHLKYYLRSCFELGN